MQIAPYDYFPADVLRCLILPQLPLPSLFACLFVSHRFYKIARTTSTFKPVLTNRQQQSHLEGLYRLGSVSLLEWFNNYLKYPAIFSRNKKDCLRVAAIGHFTCPAPHKRSSPRTPTHSAVCMCQWLRVGRILDTLRTHHNPGTGAGQRLRVGNEFMWDRCHFQSTGAVAAARQRMRVGIRCYSQSCRERTPTRTEVGARKRLRMGQFTSQVAAQNILAVLIWVRTNGCPWDADICAAAAGEGDLRSLQWAR